MTFPDRTTGGGILHGTWIADAEIATSDRRLKKGITPLHRTLLARMADEKVGPYNKNLAGMKEQRRAAIDWILRELRPVSFSFRQGIDSKSMNPRYGFVAQEVERVVPDLVHDDGSNKYMIYQDLIAMITLAAQDHQDRLEQHHGEVDTLRGLVKKLGEKMRQLQSRVSKLTGISASPVNATVV